MFASFAARRSLISDHRARIHSAASRLAGSSTIFLRSAPSESGCPASHRPAAFAAARSRSGPSPGAGREQGGRAPGVPEPAAGPARSCSPSRPLHDENQQTFKETGRGTSQPISMRGFPLHPLTQAPFVCQHEASGVPGILLTTCMLILSTSTGTESEGESDGSRSATNWG